MKIILHADMNSYFASVEQQANPLLRGKPVAICSRVSRNACVIACSIEAKKLGIKTGFSLSEAHELAPSIIALEVDPPKVRAVTSRIFAIFADYTSAVEAYSIDEAFMDLSGHVSDFAAAEKLAAVIKKRIKNEVGEWLRCSIGISHTRWLAKFAGELQKPDGLTILRKEDLPVVYAGRPVDEAWGIAQGWKARLNAIGIVTLADLLIADPFELKRRFGWPGYFLWANIAGLDTQEVKPATPTPPKSVGHSYVFHKRTADSREVSAIMMKLCERVGRRLRRLGLEARRINVIYGVPAGSLAPRPTRCGDPVFESYDIFQQAWRAFLSIWDRTTVSFMAITASELSTSSNQASLFADREKRRAIAVALDAVNERHGDYAIIRGRMWAGSRAGRERVEKWAPERVGFRQTVEPLWRGDKIISSSE
jgi:DNA polymerase IV